MSFELRPNEIMIDDTNWLQHAEMFDIVDGKRKARGLIPRNYGLHPTGSIPGIKKFDLPLIPRNEWSSRIKDLTEAKALLSDIRLSGMNGSPIPSLDQNGQGYCWAYSPTSALMILRAFMSLPYVRLSAHAIACTIKNFRDEGGWNPEAVEFLMGKGVPSVEFWPEKSMSRNNNNPATWENAGKHIVAEGWMDLEPAVYDRNLTHDQQMTCLLSGIPVPGDHNWWGHSICHLDPVEVDSSLSLTDPNRWATRIWNSWTDNWSDRGMGILRGKKSIVDGATAIRVTTASTN